MSTIEIVLTVLVVIVVGIQQYQIFRLNCRCDGLRSLTLARTPIPWGGEDDE